MNPHYDAVAARAGHRCEYCKAPEVLFNIRFEVEHIIPPREGGTDDQENLALACRSCNLFKRDCVQHLDPIGMEMAKLYHPRTDSWNEHFRISSEGLIEGLTATGRATVSLLAMNGSSQIGARQLWIRIGLF
jgi:hypothetical protein